MGLFPLFLFSLFNPFLLAAAIIPAIFLMVRIYRADRLEQEPKSFLWKMILYGFLATVIASAGEALGMWILPLIINEHSPVYRFILYFIVVALSEEGGKYLLLRRATWYSDDFNCHFDAVVYASFISLGFALLENVKYVLNYGLGTALVRAVTAVPGHACFGVFMGAFYGIAKDCEYDGYPEKSRFFRILSVIVPLLLHGAYDYIATLEGGAFSLIFILYVGIMFFIAFRLVRSLSADDRYFS